VKRHRRQWAGIALIAVTALLAAACTNSAGSVVTVSSTVYAPHSAGGTATRPHTSGLPGSKTSSKGSTTGKASPTKSATTTSDSPTSTVPAKITTSTSITEPDGFVITKLKHGQTPPQFIAVSFDGAGWDEKWQYWFSIQQQVPFHFTANLTGLYLLDAAHKDAYKGPGHPRGATALGPSSWNTPDELKQEIVDLNQAYASGDEIATHFNGHFCDSAGQYPGGNSWTTAQWNDELDQFFNFFNNYATITQVPGIEKLNVPVSSLTGERTPCLEGKQDQLYPALVAHHMNYDQSFTHRGISWPTQSPKYKIWNMGMAEFPMHGYAKGHGLNHVQITMDYNFWYTQEFNQATGQMNNTTQAESDADSAQITATYQDMLDGAMAGSHAPLLLGNHFNSWNNNAYTTALGNFLLNNCNRNGVFCVPFRDVVDWMAYQDPKVLAGLQSQPAILGPPGSHNN
jgi:hypothetical protein